jgi:transcriptional regulator with XRE-family HTH domain
VREVGAYLAGDRAVLGARLAAGRRRRRLTKPAMARRMVPHVAEQCPDLDTLISYLKRWEAGKAGISERYRVACAAALDMDEAELFGLDPMPQPAPRAPLVPPGSVGGTGTIGDWNDMERRRLLLLATLGLGAGALSAGEPVRQLLDLALASDRRSIGDWELACADHLYALRTQPPAQVRDALIVDLLAVHRQLNMRDAKDSAELHRVVAALSTLYANVLTRLGDHGAAIHWWRTARAAADQSGDLELQLGVRATEAGHALYGQRDPGTALRLTHKAQHIAGGAPSLGLALVVCSQAKALTLVGRHAEALHVLNLYRDLAASAPEPSGIMPGYWQGGQLRFAENMVLAGTGDEPGADAAGRHVLASSNPDYQVSAQVYLHNALCTVVNGGTAEGVRHAARVLDALPPVFRSHMVTETGKRVLRAVPADQQQQPEVREFCEVLAATAPSPRVLPPGA